MDAHSDQRALPPLLLLPQQGLMLSPSAGGEINLLDRHFP